MKGGPLPKEEGKHPIQNQLSESEQYILTKMCFQKMVKLGRVLIKEAMCLIV